MLYFVILKVGLMVIKYWSILGENSSDGLEKRDYVIWICFLLNIVRICSS